MITKQIEKDLRRTFPNNVCFMHPSSAGIPRLRRILRSFSYLYPDIGYCQGMVYQLVLLASISPPPIKRKEVWTENNLEILQFLIEIYFFNSKKFR